MAKKDKTNKAEMVEDKKSKKDKGSKGFSVVDFSKEEVKEGAGGKWLKKVAEGDYVWEIKSIKEERAKSGNKMLTVIFIGAAGRVKGQQTRDRFVLVPQSLYKLRQLLEAMGHDVPKKGVKIDHKSLIGSKVGGTLRDGDEYEGKIRSELCDYMPAEDVETSDDAPKGKKDKKSKKGKKGKSDDSLEDLDLESI